jgi:hypothetical protein
MDCFDVSFTDISAVVDCSPLLAFGDEHATIASMATRAHAVKTAKTALLDLVFVAIFLSYPFPLLFPFAIAYLVYSNSLRRTI